MRPSEKLRVVEIVLGCLAIAGFALFLALWFTDNVQFWYAAVPILIVVGVSGFVLRQVRMRVEEREVE